MDVIARRAATEGGMSSGEWIVRDFLVGRSEPFLKAGRSFFPCGRFRSCEDSRCPRSGITTGEEGVVGLDVLSVEVVETEGMSVVARLGSGLLFLSRRSFLVSRGLVGDGDVALEKRKERGCSMTAPRSCA